MDDGSLDKACKNNAIFLHTEGFSLEEQNTIINFFKEKYNFKMSLRNNGKGHYFVRFDTKSSEIIFQNIRKFICPSMQYKLPERHQNYFDENIINDNSSADVIKLKEGRIKEIKRGLHSHNPYKAQGVYKYDIEIEDNHNYFCQGVLVHNSLMKVWYDNGEWHLSTNNTINAFETEDFGKIFLRAARNADLQDFCAFFNISRTYLFELTSPETQVVIPYPDGVYFLTSIDTQTEKEYYDCPVIGVIKTVKTFDIHSEEEALEAASQMSRNEEGFVVVDANQHRVKIKSTEWLLAHRLVHNHCLTPRYLIELYKANMLDDLLAINPYATEVINDLKGFINNLMESCAKAWEQVAGLQHLSPKEFAIVAQKTEQPHYVFLKRKNPDLTPYSYVQNLTIPQLTRVYCS